MQWYLKYGIYIMPVRTYSVTAKGTISILAHNVPSVFRENQKQRRREEKGCQRMKNKAI